MERKIGETFVFEGKTLQVVEQRGCKGCFFTDCEVCVDENIDKIGFCCFRHDRKEMIFKEV